MESWTARSALFGSFLTVFFFAGFLGAEAVGAVKKSNLENHNLVTPMRIISPDFEPDQPIPAVFTCEGKDISPALVWENIPDGTKSLALICEDPDAPRGLWVHWIVVNIPADCRGIPQGGPLPKGSLEIRNDFGRTAWGGPCPPSGTHRYFFKLFALNVSKLEKITRRNYAVEIKKHLLAEARVMGTYRRK